MSLRAFLKTTKGAVFKQALMPRIRPAGLETRARPAGLGNFRGTFSRAGLLACLIFLSAGIPAEEPRTGNAPDAYPLQRLPPEMVQMLKERGLSGKRTGFFQSGSRLEQTPQKMDLFLLDQLQETAAQNRERSRKRVVLPPDAVASLETTNLSIPVDHSPAAEIKAAAEVRFNDNLYQGFLAILLVIAVGLLVVRKVVPEFNERMNTFFNPWTLDTAAGFERSAIVFAEEKSFSEFQAKFRIGAPVPDTTVAQTEARTELFSGAKRQIDAIQKLVQEARLSTAETAQRRILRDVLEKIDQLKSLTSHADLLPLQQMTCALEPLVRQLTEKTANITSSTLRTVTQGMELLAELCQPELKPDLLSANPLRFLVVDDETFSRYALSVALKRTLNAPDVADNVQTALELAGKHIYDVIFLDVNMPGMDGFELCSKIHETGQNRLTPVIFVTSLRDFDTRAKSIVCGGRDLISKPFLTFELTVKALTLAARERLRGRGSVVDAGKENAGNEVRPAVAPDSARQLPVNGAKKESLPPVAPGPKLENTAFRTKAALAFIAQARAQADGLLELIAVLQKTTDKDAQKESISDLFLKVHSLAAGAEACHHKSLSQIGGALENLLKKLLQNAGNITASTLQSVVTAVNLIHDLSAGDMDLDREISAPIRALAVDDDPLARRFMTNALQLKFLYPQSAPDGKTALELATGQPFDVIFLDVQMPGMDGFEVCQQIRQNDTNRRTPVVFVTSNGDPAVKAKASDCGGADFITKPYVCSELTLKTITFAFRNRLSNLNGACENPPPAPDQSVAAIENSPTETQPVS